MYQSLGRPSSLPCLFSRARPPDDVTSVEENITPSASTALSEKDKISEVKQQEEHKDVEEMECSDEQFTEEKENIASSNQEVRMEFQNK